MLFWINARVVNKDIYHHSILIDVITNAPASKKFTGSADTFLHNFQREDFKVLYDLLLGIDWIF